MPACSTSTSAPAPAVPVAAGGVTHTFGVSLGNIRETRIREKEKRLRAQAAASVPQVLPDVNSSSFGPKPQQKKKKVKIRQMSTRKVEKQTARRLKHAAANPRKYKRNSRAVRHRKTPPATGDLFNLPAGALSAKYRAQIDKVCHYWVEGRCAFGDQCRYLHASP